MSHVDALIREFRSALPDPTLPPPSEIARQARGSVRRSRRPLRRAIAFAAGGVATAAVMTALAIVFVASPKEDRASETPVVAWGMDAVVRVTPDPGVSLADATSSAISALEERGRLRDIRGLTVTRITDGEIALRVPSAEAEIQIADLVKIAGIEIFDSSTTRLGGGRDVPTIKPILDAEAGPQGEVRGYAVGAPRERIIVLGTREEMAVQRSSSTNPATEVAPISRGVFVAMISDTKGADVYRDSPALRASDIAAVRESGGALVMSIRPESIARLRRLSDSRRSGSRLVPILDLHADNTGKAHREDLGEVSRIDLARSEVTITPRFDPDRIPPLPELVARTEEGGADAELSVISSSRYGVRPPPQGSLVEVPDDLRDAIAYDSPGSPDDPKRVLSETLRNGSLIEVWVHRRPNETDMFYLVKETGLHVAMPASNFSPGGSMIQLLKLGVGYPIGRVDDSVASVEGVLANGAIVDGVVRNGWFLIETPVGSPSVTRVVARSPDGRELVSVDSFGRVTRP